MASASDSKRALSALLRQACQLLKSVSLVTQDCMALLAPQLRLAFEAFLQLSNNNFCSSLLSWHAAYVLPHTVAINRAEMFPGWLCARWQWSTCCGSQMSHLVGPVLSAWLKARHQHCRFTPQVLPWVQDCGSSLLLDGHFAFPAARWSCWFGHLFVN